MLYYVIILSLTFGCFSIACTLFYICFAPTSTLRWADLHKLVKNINGNSQDSEENRTSHESFDRDSKDHEASSSNRNDNSKVLSNINRSDRPSFLETERSILYRSSANTSEVKEDFDYQIKPYRVRENMSEYFSSSSGVAPLEECKEDYINYNVGKIRQNKRAHNRSSGDAFIDNIYRGRDMPLGWPVMNMVKNK